MMVPFVITPKWVYNFDYGFYLTPNILRQKVAFNSGCVTLAFLNRSEVGLINLSYFGGFLVKPSPTKQILLIFRFHCFLFLFPDLITWNISASVIALTFGIGTAHLPAFSFLFYFIMLVKIFVLWVFSLSSRYVGIAPFGVLTSLISMSFSSCARILMGKG